MLSLGGSDDRKESCLYNKSMKTSQINKSTEGTEVIFSGWVNSKRSHGKLTFIDLRDHHGIVQCVGVKKMNDLSLEDVIEVKGTIRPRPVNLINPDMPTGQWEVDVSEYKILNACVGMVAIPVEGDGKDIEEEVRLRYRYIDLRRERMQRNLNVRAKLISSFRSALEKRGFIEIETPILTSPTKEGARDFVVPSRVHPGSYYALPQSPQQYKQLLMTGGIEKYYQMARCFRDEGLRMDRACEFTQMDVEIAFVTQEEIIEVIHEILTEAIRNSDGKLKMPTPLYSYEYVMKTYGTDKPDLRTEEEKEDGTLAFCWVEQFPFFEKDGDKWTFTHNPFSCPIPAHESWHLQGINVDKIIAAQYDLVCNGVEVGGGSLRAYTSEMLKATYRIMGYSEQETKDSVGHMLEAFNMGTPPHGGIALGIDRLAMILCREKTVREVIAFPMNGACRTSVMNAPLPLGDEQKKELGLG